MLLLTRRAAVAGLALAACRAVPRGEQGVARAGVQPVTFAGGAQGAWRVERMVTLRGEPVPAVARLGVHAARHGPPEASWALHGVTSHARYVFAGEKAALDPLSPPLGRREATRAALIPIRKTDAWWALPHDTRREIFEERSRHIADSLRYLPRVARRLYHSRELGGPFDFLTWFELAPEHEAAFDELLALLRGREEWQHVEREVELRLSRA